VKEGIIEMLAQVLEPEDRLILEETRLMEMAALRRQRCSLLEEKIPHQPQLRRKLGHSLRLSRSFG
jgi:hypothetical protein